MPTSDNNLKVSILKQTREEKGLTLDIVHEATKVPLDALKAIEEGYSVRLMTPFYYRGFIKIYAEFLGLNPIEVQQLYGLAAGAVSKKTVGVASVVARPKKMAQPKVKSTNYAKEEAAEWIAGVFQPKNLLKVGRFFAILIALFLVVRMVGCAVGGIQKKLKEKPKTAAVVKEEKKVVVKRIEKSEPKVVEVKKAQDIKAESSDHKVRLVVRAVKDSAIQVKADGKNVFQTTMKKGTMESWDAEREIILSGKNINELDMEVNGSHVGTLGNDQRRARKVRITKEGLTVNK